MRTSKFVEAVFIAFVSVGFCGADEMIQPQRIINCHTAGLLPRGVYAFECSMYPNGVLNTPGCGTLFGATVGLLNRLNIGLSYGGDGIIGRDAPTFNPHIGALIKYRFFEETYLPSDMTIRVSAALIRNIMGMFSNRPGFSSRQVKIISFLPRFK
jgi:hypothetical protein